MPRYKYGLFVPVGPIPVADAVIDRIGARRLLFFAVLVRVADSDFTAVIGDVSGFKTDFIIFGSGAEAIPLRL